MRLIGRLRLILFIFITQFFGYVTANAQNSYQFEHINLPIEKQDTQALCLLEDSRGFIWIGFNGGLSYYDGYKGKSVLLVLADGTKQEFSRVQSLVEDRDHNIWVGTNNGVYIYNPATGVSNHLNDPKIANSTCRSLNITSKGEILVGTTNGLYIVNGEKEIIEQYIHQPGLEHSLSNSVIRTTYEDNEGNIWIGTYDKLNLLERENKRITHFRLQSSESSMVAVSGT